MAYFNNAATSYAKPQEVYEAMDRTYRSAPGSPGRGGYAQAETNGQIVDAARRELQDLLHCEDKEIVFQATATQSLNVIINGVLGRGCKAVYVSPFEHNAVTRVLHHWCNQDRIEVRQLPIGQDLTYDMEECARMFSKTPPDVVIMSHASNVIGLIAPAADVFSLAKEYNASTVLDMAQTAGVVDFDVGSDNVDYAVFAGHKTLLGPTGIAGFAIKPQDQLEPLIYGGTGVDSANSEMPESIPERFEAGTPNVLGIIGLHAAVRWIRKQTIDELRRRENENRGRLIELLSSYDFVRVIGNVPGRSYVGIVSCQLEGISSDSAERLLAEHGVQVRGGLHCAPNAHRFLGTFPSGTIRFSVSALTSDADFKELQSALDTIGDDL